MDKGLNLLFIDEEPCTIDTVTEAGVARIEFSAIACLGAWIIIVNGREIINVKVKTLKLLRLRVLDFRFLYIVYVVRFFILAFHC